MIRLHHVAFSRSFRILWLLEEMGITPEVIPYRISDGSLRDPAFLSKSPMGRVPALDIDGVTLFESAAIVQYLCETRPDAGLAPQVGDPERAEFLQWLSYAETQASILASLNLQMIFLRPPAKPSAAVLKLEIARLKGSLRGLEQVLGNQDWLLPSGFSAADTMLGFNLFSVPYFVKLDGFPNIQAYMHRMQDRPAFGRARAQDGPQEFYDQEFYPVLES